MSDRYQINYWTARVSHLGGTAWASGDDLLERVASILREKPIRIEIYAYDLDGNPIVGANGVNGPGWRT